MRASLMLALAALAAAWVVASVPARAADMIDRDRSASAPAKDQDLLAGDAALKAGRYADAVALFEKVVQRNPRNADAWNDLGFSNRKLGKYSDALADYEKALAIDPDHLGANEYLGELYVETGDMAKAQERLAKLDHLCTFGCKEYRMLKAAIEQKKAKSGG